MSLQKVFWFNPREKITPCPGSGLLPTDTNRLLRGIELATVLSLMSVLAGCGTSTPGYHQAPESCDVVPTQTVQRLVGTVKPTSIDTGLPPHLSVSMNCDWESQNNPALGWGDFGVSADLTVEVDFSRLPGGGPDIDNTKSEFQSDLEDKNMGLTPALPTLGNESYESYSVDSAGLQAAQFLFREQNIDVMIRYTGIGGVRTNTGIDSISQPSTKLLKDVREVAAEILPRLGTVS